MSRRTGPWSATRTTAVAAVALLAALAGASPAASAGGWLDAVPAETVTRAHLVRSPTEVRCSVAVLTVTLSWADVDPRYDYLVTLRRLDTGAVLSTREVTGTATSLTWAGLPALGLGLVTGRVTLVTEVRSYLAATPAWLAPQAADAPAIHVTSGVTTATATC